MDTGVIGPMWYNFCWKSSWISKTGRLSWILSSRKEIGALLESHSGYRIFPLCFLNLWNVLKRTEETGYTHSVSLNVLKMVATQDKGYRKPLRIQDTITLFPFNLSNVSYVVATEDKGCRLTSIYSRLGWLVDKFILLFCIIYICITNINIISPVPVIPGGAI